MRHLLSSVLALSCVCLVDVARVQAQTRDGSEARGPHVEAAARVEAPEKKREPMGAFAIGFKFGVAHVGTGSVDNPTYLEGSENLPQDQLEEYGLTSRNGCDPVDRRCRTDARRGYHIALPIQIGGSGVGYRLEPYITFGADAQAYGVYTGPTFEFHVAEPLYLGFGFGLKAARVEAEGWKYAADIYGRIPVWLTLYLGDDFALVGEFAYGAGASGYVSEQRNIYNPTTMEPVARRSDVTFGFGRTWDASIGIRFP